MQNTPAGEKFKPSDRGFVRLSVADKGTRATGRVKVMRS